MATHHRNLVKNKSGSRLHKSGQSVKRHSAHAAQKPKSVQIQGGHPEDQDEDIMAVSFLQYCATCERQIVTPSNSILYCSESCRRKDTARALSGGPKAESSPPLTPLPTSSSFDKLPAHDIVPQRSPTVSQSSKRFSYSSFSEDETTYSEDERSLSSRRESEAERYLRRFYEADQQQAAGSQSRTPRPLYNRSSTSYSFHSQAPSLSHSPTSTALGLSFPYTPVSTTSRPLPPRTNPTYSTSFKYSRSSDLVNPFPSMTQVAFPTTAPSSLHHNARSLKSSAGAAVYQTVAEGELMYEKNPIALSTSGPECGSLKKLFRFSEMQAPPAAYEYSRQ